MTVFHTCARCDETILDPVGTRRCSIMTSAGVHEGREHVVCAVRDVVGGMNCLLKRCRCHGGTDPPDPPGATRYQAAVIAAALWSTIDE